MDRTRHRYGYPVVYPIASARLKWDPSVTEVISKSRRRDSAVASVAVIYTTSAAVMESSQGLLLICLALLSAMAGATQFRVGGSKGWSVPDPDAVSYNQWAEKSRFQVGDSLLFVYPPGEDSVLLVDKDAYDACNTNSFIEKHDDGNTVFTFDRSGPFYFISGVEANCMRNESVVIVVMADRSNRSSSSSSSPPPSPSSPPPFPPESAEATPAPAPAPAEEEPNSSPPPPNAASSRVVGFMGSVGCFVGSIIVVL
ncbi:hypothetical protein BHM03_00010992 [Ensete ventricosum]|nr:hypothetical protein BHM03_00010992 [Ensete ventricosum]